MIIKQRIFSSKNQNRDMIKLLKDFEPMIEEPEDIEIFLSKQIEDYKVVTYETNFKQHLREMPGVSTQTKNQLIKMKNQY